MPELTWQKSSLCGTGDSCIHVAATPQAIHMTESADPTGAVLTTTPDAFRSLLHSLKGAPAPHPRIHITTTEDGTVRLHSPGAATVTTDHHKWTAFVLGVRAGEFDHFVN
ncbi:DUF397 domain-containing protein [Streptomyces sp. NPDC052013]|uniref:DUF397 domain-containing protein n=1 Tax=Streptomyces sp. NPDC052013 TaxID=3365679 RepID=UPI0037D40742